MKLALAALVLCGCGRLNFTEHDAATPDDTRIDTPPIVMNEAACPAAGPPTGTIVAVSTGAELVTAVASAGPNTTISLADGTYTLTSTLRVTTSGISLRSASNDASKVRIQGDGTFAPLFRIQGSGFYMTSVTLTNSTDELVFVEGSAAMDTNNVNFYDVTFIDAAGPLLRVRSYLGVLTGPFSDIGSVACSRFAPSGSALGCGTATWAIVGDAARSWNILNNVFDRRACTTESFRTVWFDSGSRDIKVYNNLFLGTNYGVLFGGAPTRRTYTDPVPANCVGSPDVWGGLLCNNVFASAVVPPRGGFDVAEGIALWSACDTWVLHNTIIGPSTQETFSSVEYRYTDGYVHIANNVLAVPLMARDGGRLDTNYSVSNMTYASHADFIDAVGGNLRPSPSSSVPTGVIVPTFPECINDADGVTRSVANPRLGAFEL